MDNILTVSEVNEQIEKILLNSHLKNIDIQGEMSNITYHKGGHLYFNLKEKTNNGSEAVIKCIVFSYRFKNVPMDLKEGTKVKVRADISFYKQNGSVSFICNKFEKVDDIGDIYRKLEELKKKYLEKGYFDKDKKKIKPMLVKKIGIVTSKTGAAIEDIKTTAFNRDENIQIFLYPVNVQGKNAKYEIVDGIKYFNDNQDKYNLDVLIVGRGGGSIEDLWAFNEEEVIEAIYQSDIFVVSAVGHDIDVLLSDYVADLRAPTPTGAAEILIPKKEDVLASINNFDDKLNMIFNNRIKNLKSEINNFKNSYGYSNFSNLLVNYRLSFDDMVLKFEKEIKNIFEYKKRELSSHNLGSFKISILAKLNKEELILENLKRQFVNEIENELKNLRYDLDVQKLKLSKHSNEDILKKGYSITRYKGKIVKSVKNIKKGETLETTLSDGNVISEVI